MSGLRQQMDEEVEKRREQREDLKQIRADLSGIEQKITGLKDVAERLDRGDLTKTIEEVMEAVESVGGTASRVAKTFQARQEDLETIREAGEEANDLKEALRNVRVKLWAESIVRHTTAMVLTLILIGALLWITGIVTPSLPQWMRMSDKEIALIEEGKTARTALNQLEDEEAEALRALIEKGSSTEAAK